MEEVLEKVAKLGRINIKDKKLSEEIRKILEWLSDLPSFEKGDMTSSFSLEKQRKDSYEEFKEKEQIVRQFPKRRERFCVV